jgi:hypothetical protein
MDNPCRDGVVEHLDRPRREHQQDPRVGKAAREEVQRLPGRAVRQVDIIKHDNKRRPQAQGCQQIGKRREDANARGATGAAMTDRRADGRKNHRKIAGRNARHVQDFTGIESAQLPFERFDPQAKPRRRAQRVRTRGQRHHVVTTGSNLSREPCLPHARIAEQQHNTQLTLFDNLEGFVEEQEVRLSSHQRQTLRNTGAGDGAHARARCRPGHTAPQGLLTSRPQMITGLHVLKV